MYGEHEAHMHWHTLDAEHRDGYCRIPASYAVLLQGGILYCARLLSRTASFCRLVFWMIFLAAAL